MVKKRDMIKTEKTKATSNLKYFEPLNIGKKLRNIHKQVLKISKKKTLKNIIIFGCVCKLLIKKHGPKMRKKYTPMYSLNGMLVTMKK